MRRTLGRFAATALAASFFAATASAQTYTFASLPQGTLINFQVSMISKMLLDKTKLKVRAVPMNGSDATMRAVDNGEAEFTLSDVTRAAAAIKGEDVFKGRAVKNVRAVSQLLTFTVGIVVPKDSAIRKVADVRGKRMPVGWAAFPQGQRLLEAMLKSGGLNVSDIVGVPTPDLVRAADDLKAGNVDASTYAPQAPKMKEVDAAIGIRFISLPNTPDSIRGIKSVAEDFYLVKLNPRPGLTGIVEPIDTLAFDLAIVTGTHVKDEAVYELAKAVHEHGEELKKSSPIFGSFRANNVAKQFSTLQYHPAALKYYKEKGLLPAK